MAAAYEAYAGVTYERIDKVGLQYPVPTMFKETFPSGRGKFYPLDYVAVKEMPDNEYPFILTTGRLLEHWLSGTMTRHSSLNDVYPEARVEMHSITNNMPVRVTSRRGEIVLRCTVTEKKTESFWAGMYTIERVFPV